MSLALLIDFGSTFTKILAVDLSQGKIVGYAQSPTTVETDIMVGLTHAFQNLPPNIQKGPYACKLASSSAAGGLGMATVGLIPELSAEAARRAALGAGAKVLKVYSFRLTALDVQELESLSPDIILLAGGIDGGNSHFIIENAKKLAGSRLACPIVVAGNRVAADEVSLILQSAGKSILRTENVMPDVNVLNVEPAREMIRKVFIERIVEAKGLKKAEEFVEGILMPTPTAVLHAAQLLARGTGAEKGQGDLVIVDVGGATTDIHSVSWGEPTQPGVVRKGLPEPWAKRTVEGDLGIRYNAPSIVQLCGEERLRKNLPFLTHGVCQKIENLSRNVGFIPRDPEDQDIDFALAASAAQVAMERHAGIIQALWGPHGQYFVQYGKDLTAVPTLIGTGGVFIHHPRADEILQKTLFAEDEPFSLRPKNPTLYTDAQYCLFAIGLLAERFPDLALRIARKYLKRWN